MDFSTYFINRFTDFAGIRYGGLPPKICRAVLTLRHTARRQKLVCVSIHGTTHVSHKPFLESAVLWNSAVTVTTAWRQGSDRSRLAVYSTAYNAWREKKKKKYFGHVWNTDVVQTSGRIEFGVRWVYKQVTNRFHFPCAIWELISRCSVTGVGRWPLFYSSSLGSCSNATQQT